MKLKKPIIIFLAMLAVFIFAKHCSAAVIHRAPNNLGLVGYWSFNEGTGTKATDYSGNGNTGTLNGANGLPVWTVGKSGTALRFDGADDHVTVNANSILQPSIITISAWIKPSSLDDDWIVSTQTSDPYNYNYGYVMRVQYPENTVNCYFGRGSSTAGTSQVPVIAGIWQHIICSYDGSYARIYLNSVEATPNSAAGSMSYAGTENVYISSHYSTSRHFVGQIDEVRIYNRALSAAEVATLYKSSGLSQINPSAQNKALTSGLVGLWSFNGADMDWASTTAEARDRSGQNNHGDVIGPKAAIGQVGQALQFSRGGGGATYMSLSGSGGLQDVTDNSFSFVAWFKPVSIPSGTNNGVGTVVGRPGYHTVLGYNSGQKILLSIYNNL